MTIEPSRFARVLRIGGLNKSGSLWEWKQRMRRLSRASFSGLGVLVRLSQCVRCACWSGIVPGFWVIYRTLKPRRFWSLKSIFTSRYWYLICKYLYR
ncbi:uncharacterized protein K444DRAFT_187533 [Hyaloscypha bicolor E]|uniref:Uncharacterized protein n=1 Tax=Hyaloscypha bicolor E TaxID=1095630 RepID=A0A2J6SPG8_9HELO|nr:uncharacterized protein K444DRAFT_187533 [Hyaloscypha bicolor E]PMD52661.1 hypothetical protein K444DRAFT_187533 [Hyaloscypha bicolor E]